MVETLNTFSEVGSRVFFFLHFCGVVTLATVHSRGSSLIWLQDKLDTNTLLFFVFLVLFDDLQDHAL
jgi:hypothetical protein